MNQGESIEGIERLGIGKGDDRWNIIGVVKVRLLVNAGCWYVSISMYLRTIKSGDLGFPRSERAVGSLSLLIISKIRSSSGIYHS